MVRVMYRWEAELAEASPTLTRSSWERERRRRSQGERSGLRLHDGWRRTSGDEALLSFLSRFTVISVRQASRWFYGDSWETARQRIRKMVEVGLLQRDDTISWAGPVVWPTLEGQRAALGPDHPLVAATRPRESQMLHRLLVTEEAASLVTSGREVFSEREVRTFETRGADELGHWLSERGVKLGDGLESGVVPTSYQEGAGKSGAVQRQRWLACVTEPPGSRRRVMRFPDLVEVTDEGELRAIEVEITPKDSTRVRTYIDGYRDSGPYLDTGDDGKMQVRRRQFRYVRWLCTPPVQRAFLGHPGGVDSMTGAPALGLIRQSYSEQTNPFIGDTSKVYMKPVVDPQTQQRTYRVRDFDRDGTIAGMPMSAETLTMPPDDGIAWRLAHLFLPERLYCSLGEWGRWRDLWLSDLDKVGRTEHEVPFYQWLTLGGNDKRCHKLTR